MTSLGRDSDLVLQEHTNTDTNTNTNTDTNTSTNRQTNIHTNGFKLFSRTAWRVRMAADDIMVGKS